MWSLRGARFIRGYKKLEFKRSGIRSGGAVSRCACVLEARIATAWELRNVWSPDNITLHLRFEEVDGAMKIKRQEIIAAIGGPYALKAMDDEARAEALENHLAKVLDAQAKVSAPSVAELDEQIETRTFRRGVGSLFSVGGSTPSGELAPGEPRTVRRLPPLPPKPTLLDYFKLRFAPARHALQSADRALTTGMAEDVVLACLLHDLGQTLMKTDHGWWGAQLVAPYVSEKIAFAIKYHQALRFFPDPFVGYEYPEQYNFVFGNDYVPPPYIRAAYEHCRKHKWYMSARLITVNDLYSFDPNHFVDLEKFTDIVGRHFKQPKEGLGFDNSSSAHMWRTISTPDTPL